MKQQNKLRDLKKNKKEITPVIPEQTNVLNSIKSQNRIIYLIIFIFTFILYGNTLSHDYALDDAIVITQNQFTKKGVDGIKEIFATEGFTGFFGVKKNLVAGGRYRPLSLVTFAIEWEFFKNSPGLSHFVNILLYALTGILLFIVLSRLLVRYETKHWYFSLPFLSTILFIAHPIHTEVIANIKGRDEIMTFLGAIAALYFTLKYLETKKSIHLFFSFAVFFLALMSKENAITFIAVIPLSVFFFTGYKSSKNFIAVLPLLAATFVFLVIRQKVLGSFTTPVARELMNNPFIDMTTGQQYATVFYTLGIYLKLLFIPHPLTFDYYPYHIPIMNWGDIKTILPLIVYVAVGIYGLVNIKKKSILSFSILYYMATISIVSNILFSVGAFMNERFVYMSSLGFCLAVAYIVVSKIPMFLKSEKASVYAMSGFMVVVLLMYSGKTISRNAAWKDDFTLFTTDVKVSQNSAKSNCSAGGKLVEEAIKPANQARRNEYLKQAITYLNKSVSIHPTYADALLLLGNAHYEYNKNYDSTLIAYKKILAQNPNYERVFTNLEIILNKNENVDFKMKVWEDLYKINPNRFEVNYGLGQIYGRYKNDTKKALPYLEKAVQLKPSNVAANKDLGVAFGILGNFKKSAEILEKTAALDPKDEQIFYNLGVTYMQLGDKAKAAEFIKKAEVIKAQKSNKK